MTRDQERITDRMRTEGRTARASADALLETTRRMMRRTTARLGDGAARADRQVRRYAR